MRLLVFNCGSSSLKYRLIEMPDERERVALGLEAQGALGMANLMREIAG